MAQLGIILLIHSSFERAAQTARLWRDAGCPVVVHIDKAAPSRPAKAFQDQFQSDRLISFAPRYKTAWGGWGLVKASQAAAALLLRRSPELGHILLTSQSCLMLRPPEELIAFLKKTPALILLNLSGLTKFHGKAGALNKNDFTGFFPSTGRANGVCSKRLWRFKKPVRCAGNHRQICACIWDHNGGA
ncbi:MAG: beta-1,6-N-acetylglucosaminyltransferase [Paracoccaceae bacterium]|jgi:hypothetical protein|nr:beta-1,6-N-acetylglucosaminyltransferase [Paracoccaceae bacterium]